MNLDGVVVKRVEVPCLVEHTLANARVMKVLVVLATYKLIVAATVARRQKLCHATNAEKKYPANALLQNS